jgi:bleomycin hydrolase
MLSLPQLSSRFLLAALVAFEVTVVSAQPAGEEVLRALERIPHPVSAADFKPVPHLPCMNQGNTQICWSFATCSFIESEMARLQKPPVRLSVIYPVYCQFLEKAHYFVQTKGASRFDPGDLFTGVPEVCRRYGALPAEAYEKLPNHKRLDQTHLYSELQDLMAGVKQRQQWDEAQVLSKLRRILNRHLGEPPDSFSFNQKRYTPQSFADQVVCLPWSDYLMFTSFEYSPFSRYTEFKVPDNWQHNTNYFNLPLPAFYRVLTNALRTGFSVAVSIDTTEPSYETTGRYAFIPDADIPAAAITQDAREFRFRNGTTTDDHAVHIIGCAQFGAQDWFLAKDSSATAWRGTNKGCLFLHDSYVKLKVLAFLVHRDGVPEELRAP